MKRTIKVSFFLIILSAVIIRLFHLFNSDINSDEAIVGLMGKHILEGEFPVYYYGQNYMGALEAYLAAILFFIFGSSPIILKMAPFLCSILFVITTFFLVKKLSNENAGILAMLFTAIPPYFLTIWSNAARGGYIETLLFGNIIFILTIKLIIEKNKQNITLILLGFVCGVSWWVNQLVFYYILTAFICLLIYPISRNALFKEKINLVNKKQALAKYHSPAILSSLAKILNLLIIFGIIVVFFNLNCGKFGIDTGFVSIYCYKRDSIKLLIGAYLAYLVFFRKRGLYIPKGTILFLIAFTTGNMPTCIYGLSHKLFAGTNIIEINTFSTLFSNYWKTGIPILLGLPKTWNSGIVLHRIIQISIFSSYTFFVFYFLFNILKHIIRYKTYPPIRYTLTIIMFVLIPIIFSVSRYGRLTEEPRYILPFYTVLAICYSVTTVELFKEKPFKLLSAFFAVFIILFNIKSNFLNLERKQLEIGNIPANDKKVIEFMLSREIHYACADYWVAYKLIFESNEKIICASPNYSRYPKYEELVSKQSNPAYIMRDEENEAFINYLDINKVSYKVEHIMNYWVYYSIDTASFSKNSNDQTEKYIKIIPDKWGADSNINKNNIKDAFDGDLSTRWTSNIAQYSGMFLVIDLKEVYKIIKVGLTSYKDIYDHPRGCRIEVSVEGRNWQIVKDIPRVGADQFVFPPLSHPLRMYWGWLEFSFDPINARYIKIIQTGKNNGFYWWSINEVCVYSENT